MISIYLQIYVKLKEEQNIYCTHGIKHYHRRQSGLQENVKILYGHNTEKYMHNQEFKLIHNLLFIKF